MPSSTVDAAPAVGGALLLVLAIVIIAALLLPTAALLLALVGGLLLTLWLTPWLLTHGRRGQRALSYEEVEAQRRLNRWAQTLRTALSCEDITVQGEPGAASRVSE